MIHLGAGVNETTQDGKTPLTSAAFKGSIKCVQKLLSAGAEVNCKGIKGRTPLIEAVWGRWATDSQQYFLNNCNQKECVKMLIDAGANVNAQTDDGISALMRASGNGYEGCVILLLDAGADVNATCKDDGTSLIYSAIFGCEACLSNLLAAGADVNRSMKNRIRREGTAVCIASTYGHEACLKSLIEVGADVNLKDDEECTALVRAACIASFKCIKHLLNAGANINATTTDNVTALMAVCSIYEEYRCKKMLEHMENRYLSENHSAIKSVETLIDEGADVNINVPLIAAVSGQNKECVPVLLAAGADVNATDGAGSSALMASIIKYRDNIFHQLLKAGADVNVINKNGATALVVAAMTGNVYMAKGLLKANCFINKTVGMPQDPLISNISNFRPVCAELAEILLMANEINKITGPPENALMSHLNNFRPVYGELVRLLFAAGESLDDGFVDGITEHSEDDDNFGGIARYFLDLKNRNLQLKHICREAIRKHLLDLDPHQHLFGRVPLLGLPELVSLYLLYDESLDDDNNDDDGDDDDDNGDNDDNNNNDTDHGDDDDDDQNVPEYRYQMTSSKRYKPHKISLTEIKELF